jgi:hypothetical protein
MRLSLVRSRLVDIEIGSCLDNNKIITLRIGSARLCSVRRDPADYVAVPEPDASDRVETYRVEADS